MVYRSSDIYNNVGANNNNENNNNSNNSRMHEISPAPIRKILGVTARRQTKPRPTTKATITTTRFSGSDSQKHGESKVFSGIAAGKRSIHNKFDVFRGFVGLHQFRRLQYKN